MIQIPPDFKEFLRLLNFHQVEYLLIGGYAVGYYGFVRATGDMDIWVKIDRSTPQYHLTTSPPAQAQANDPANPSAALTTDKSPPQ